MVTPKKDVSTFEICDLVDQHEDLTWWNKRPISDRVQALLTLRKIVYGNAVTGRLQRILEVVELREC